jgi:hypothetical protein
VLKNLQDKKKTAASSAQIQIIAEMDEPEGESDNDAQ